MTCQSKRTIIKPAQAVIITHVNKTIEVRVRWTTPAEQFRQIRTNILNECLWIEVWITAIWALHDEAPIVVQNKVWVSAFATH